MSPSAAFMFFMDLRWPAKIFKLKNQIKYWLERQWNKVKQPDFWKLIAKLLSALSHVYISVKEHQIKNVKYIFHWHFIPRPIIKLYFSYSIHIPTTPNYSHKMFIMKILWQSHYHDVKKNLSLFLSWLFIRHVHIILQFLLCF